MIINEYEQRLSRLNSFIELDGLMSKWDHKKLREMCKDNDIKLVTFGLTELSASARKLEFVNEQSVAANFDNDKSKEGSMIWGTVKTMNPSEVKEFVTRNNIDHIIIMSDADAAIGRQLDQMGLRYYSWRLLKNIHNTTETAGQS